MSSGEVHAWHFATRTPVRIKWHAGQIVELTEVSENPAEDIWIAPPLWDLQVNGYAGVDFQQDTVSDAELVQAIRGLRRDGCTKFLLTLITDEWERTLARVRHYAGLRRANLEIHGAMLGFHIEGPFLSSEPGYCGAHNPNLMLNATPEHLDELRAAAGDVPLLLTVAPERFSSKMSYEAGRRNIHINIGHTNSNAHGLQWTFGKGTARAFTHLGNGCPRLLDRHDNIIFRVFNDSALPVSVIPDAIHVPAELFRLIHRLKGDDLYYVSDAMSAGGAGPGIYRLGNLTLEVKEDGIVRLPGTPNFAGSSLAPIDGIFRAGEMLKRDWQDVWKYFSETPAKRIDRENLLEAGTPADFCVLKWTASGDENYEETTLAFTTYVAGIPTRRETSQ
jgi:N-acetylglucosamine-6-phosphate deacetylase